MFLKKINPWFAATFVLAAVFIFCNSWAGSLVNSDDAIYAQIISQLAENDKWFDLQWLDFDYQTKPPLFFWLGAASVKIFSLNEFALRLPAALAGFLTVLALFIFARKLCNDSGAFIASMILLGFELFINLSHRVMMDIPLLFFLTFSLFSFLFTLENKKYFYPAWISLGLAFLIKGYLFLPAVLVALIFFAVIRRFKIIFAKDSILGFLLALTLMLPWQVYRFVSSGSDFTGRFIGNQIVNHYTDAMAIFKKPFFYYLSRFYERDFAIFLLFVISIALFVIYRKKHNLEKSAMLFIWIIVYFLIFSFSSSKIDHYIIGIYPPIALLIGMTLSRVEIKRQKLVLYSSCALAFLISIAAFIPYMNAKSWHVDSSGSIKRLVSKYNRIAEKNTLYVYKIYIPAPLFYAETPVIEIEPDKRRFAIINGIEEFKATGTVLNMPEAEFASMLSSDNKAFCLVKKADFDDLVGYLNDVEVAGREPGYLLISRRLR